MTDPADFARRVLDALAEGRRRANAQAQARRHDLEVLVAAALRRDVQLGHPTRGRPVRIAHELRGLVSARHVLRILQSDRFSSVSDSMKYNGHGPTD